MLNLNSLSLNSLQLDVPGYVITRAQLAERRDHDLKTRKSSWLDEVGEIMFLDPEHAFVVPAQELGYIAADQIRNLNLPRLIKLVASEDAGVLCTFSAHVSKTWMKTFSKFGLPADLETDRHFVKCFAPGYEGAVVSYHAIRDQQGQLSCHTVEQASGHAICAMDFVSYEGKAHFAATTLPTLAQPSRAVLVREVATKAIKELKSVNAEWQPAAWSTGNNVTNLRGYLKDGARMYSFLDIDQGALMTAAPSDKSAKTVRKNIKGVLTTVSGAVSDRQHVGTVISDDKIIAIGKDEAVIADLTTPAYTDLYRMVRNAKRVTGLAGKNGMVFMTTADSPLSMLTVTKLDAVRA